MIFNQSNHNAGDVNNAMSPDIVCRGCWSLGNNCGLCSRCIETRPSPPPLAMWMIACNDRHGGFNGEIAYATLELCSLVELEGPALGVRFCGDAERCGPTFRGEYRAAPHMLKVYGHGRLPVWRRGRNVGNIHWDSVGISARRTPTLLWWLRAAGWTMTAGPTPLFDAFREGGESPHPIDFQAAVGRSLGLKDTPR